MTAWVWFLLLFKYYSKNLKACFFPFISLSLYLLIYLFGKNDGASIDLQNRFFLSFVGNVYYINDVKTIYSGFGNYLQR